MSTSLCKSMTLTAAAPAQSGHGDLLEVTPIGETLRLCIARQPCREDGRDRRSITMRLGRHEAIALGRHLISQAGGLIDLGVPADADVRVSVMDEDQQGRYVGTIAAERIAGTAAIVTTQRTYIDAERLYSTSIWLGAADLRSLALGMLALAQD